MTKKTAKKRAVMAKPLEDDERFNEITQNPLFQEMRKKDRKVTVDKRFKEMFTDQQFGIGRTKTDIRGRPLAKDQRKDVKSLYELSESEEEKSEKEEESDGEIKIDLARGSGNMCSSDEDSESDTDSEVEREDGQNEVIWDKLQTGIRHVEWASKRLAICNMDWDHVKGEDLLLLLQSFKPASGEVKAVAIYLSDFGAERLEAEEKEGPKMEIKKAEKKVVDGQDVDEETRSAIRAYQFDRMRYYYAVVDCDTIETATSIYEACDRVEYESSGVQLDLRFVPDETTFDESRLRERVTIDNVNVNKYKANYFETAAIRFQNPKVTWDETNPDRLKKVDRIMKKENPDEASDLEDLIAPGSDEEEASDGENGDKKNAFKELLAAAGIERNEKKSSMVVDWEPVTKFSDAESDDENEEIEKGQKKKKQTPFQEYLERRKVEKKKRKTLIKERKQKAKEEDEENRREIEANIAAAVKRRPKKSELASNLTADISDKRFDALFSSADFAIDKTNMNFKGGELADQQVRVKLDRKRKIANTDTSTTTSAPAATPPSTNEELIKKLKAKSNKLRKT